MSARLTCGHCGTALDPDAPGAACATCHAEAPSPTSRPSRLAQVVATACALAGPGRAITAADVALAAAIHRGAVQA